MEDEKYNRLKINALDEICAARGDQNILDALTSAWSKAAAEYIVKENKFAMDCWKVRIESFQGNARKAAQWVRDNTTIQEPDRISRLMAVGRMLYNCHEADSGIFDFLFNLPIRKNEVLSGMGAGQVIRFVMERGKKVIQDSSRDELRKIVRDFRGEKIHFEKRREKRNKLKIKDLNEICAARGMKGGKLQRLCRKIIAVLQQEIQIGAE